MQPSIQQLVQQEVVRILAGAVMGRKDIAGDPSGQWLTGPGGTFNLPGVNRDFISLVLQKQSLWNSLPAHASMYAETEFGYITAFTAGSGQQPTEVCGDGPVPGSITTCTQTSHFGRYRFDTNPLPLNRVGLLAGRAEPTDLRLINGPLQRQLQGLLPGGIGDYSSNIFNSRREVASRMGDVAREFTDLLSDELWFGVPKAAGDPTIEGSNSFLGLNSLVGTGKIDARTLNACPLLDSDVKDFGGDVIDADGGQKIFNYMYYIVQTRRFIARRTNMGAVNWRWVMPESAWMELAKLWPCVFATYGCLPQPDGRITPTISLDNQARLQQDMIENMYLPIGGQRYPVVIDDSLVETVAADPADGFTCDMFFMPYTVKGGYEVLFREYLDFKQGAMLGAAQGQYGPGVFQTDDGQFLWWTKPNNNVCIQLGSETDQRVILLTPQLAGRINSVGYDPLQHVTL
jgi:hypothetical protein